MYPSLCVVTLGEILISGVSGVSGVSGAIGISGVRGVSESVCEWKNGRYVGVLEFVSKKIRDFQ